MKAAMRKHNMADSQRHQKQLVRFIAALLVVVAYAAYTIHEFGVQQGLSVTGLTWAFFVFATPIADAGFLLAFPIRLIAGVRMLYTQVFVWLFGAALVGFYLMYDEGVFAKTSVLQLFHAILTTPWPLWLILILSFIGTYVSIIFDDDIIDVAGATRKKTLFRHKRKQLVFSISIFLGTLLLYFLLLQMTDIAIALW